MARRSGARRSLARTILIAVAAAALALSGLYRHHREAAAPVPLSWLSWDAPAAGSDSSDDTLASASSSSSTCITFLGDTMLANLGKDYSAPYLNGTWSSALTHLRPALHRCSTVVANLEGPITPLGDPRHDPARRGPAYSFAIDPAILRDFLANEAGVTHFGRANNHLWDRGERGIADTASALWGGGINGIGEERDQPEPLPHFGSGRSAEEAAAPMVVSLGSHDAEDGFVKGITVGITGYSDFYSQGVLPSRRENRTGILPVRSEYVRLAHDLLDDTPGGVDLRVAFVHWGDNYKPVSDEMREQAALLLSDDEDGRHYDLIIGSDGSHTVQEFDYVHPNNANSTAGTNPGPGRPVLYNIGNFLFHTPGRFGKSGALPYGTIVHVHLGRDDRPPYRPRLGSMELHCTVVDNRAVDYRPRICTAAQAAELFGTLGPHVNHRPGDAFATVIFRQEEGGSATT